MHQKHSTAAAVLTSLLTFSWQSANAANADSEIAGLRKEVAELRAAVAEFKKNPAASLDNPKIRKAVVSGVRTVAKRTGLEGESNGFGRGSEGLQKKIEEAFDQNLVDRPLDSQPAFVALGLDTKVSPGSQTPREFAASVINGVDKSGVIQTGVAASVSLGKVLEDLHWNGCNWEVDSSGQPNYFCRLLKCTTLSFATAKASDGGSKALRLAGGINLVLWDYTDERRRTDVEYLHKYEFNSGADRNGEQLPMSVAEVAKRIDNYRWKKGGLSLGWAPTWLTADGNGKNLRYEGSTTFLNTTWVAQPRRVAHFLRNWSRSNDIPAEKDDNLIAFSLGAQYREGESLVGTTSAEKGKVLGRQDSLLLAGRLTYGSARFNGSVEGGYLKNFNGQSNGKRVSDQDAIRVVGALSLRISKNTYLVASAGQDFGGTEQLFTTAGIQFGLDDDSNFKKSEKK